MLREFTHGVLTPKPWLHQKMAVESRHKHCTSAL